MHFIVISEHHMAEPRNIHIGSHELTIAGEAMAAEARLVASDAAKDPKAKPVALLTNSEAYGLCVSLQLLFSSQADSSRGGKYAPDQASNQI